MKLLQKSMLLCGILSVSINIFCAGVSQDTMKKALPAAVLAIAARFAPPAYIQKIIDKNQEVIEALPDDEEVYKLESSPVLYIKSSQFDRVINAYRMQNFLTKNNISTITVPKKYVSKVGYKFMVFVEAVDVEEITSINLEETNDLITFIEGTGYRDLHSGNLKRDTKTGKLIILDTENRSFSMARIECFSAFAGCFGDVLTQEARDVFQNHFETFFKPKLYQDTQYDGELDFSSVQEYIASFAR